jgi:hypothetical protein
MKVLYQTPGWLLALMFAIGIAACEREGPMEQAGEEVDEAVAEASEDAAEAKEDIKEGIEDAREKMQN